jgi:diguanylate cyclase (GGDEF)-like protein/PAS domain S-box-containing protein
MDFDLNKLQDIVSPYIILIRQSKVVFISDPLAIRLGIARKEEIEKFFKEDKSLLESFEKKPEKVFLPAKDGDPFDCSYTNTTFNDLKLIAFTQNVASERIDWKEQAPELFFDMTTHSNNSFLIIEKGHIVYANNKFLENIGYESDDVLGRQIISFISRQSREDFITFCGEGLKHPQGVIPSGEIMLTSRSGKRLNMNMNGGMVSRGGKDYLWLVMISTTEKILLERSLEEEQYKFSELFDLSPIGLLYISPRGTIIDSNEFVCRIMGYDKEEIRGSEFSKFVVPHEEQRLRQEFGALFLKGAGIQKQQCMLRTKQGADITIEYNVQVISRKGRNVRALMVFSDITDKKELETELLEKNAEMEKTLWEMAEVKDALEARAGELIRATEELQVLNEKLNQLSITDGLTEIYNHRHFQDRLSDEVERVQRNRDGVISLLILDIDDFKRYNDTYGHQCGDMVLKQLAGILKSSVRNIDILARYGGEEFAVILPNANVQEAAKVAQRICESVRSTPFSFGGGTSVKVTVSIGVGSLTHGKAEKAELIQKADNALYAAKAKWKDRVEIWEED